MAEMTFPSVRTVTALPCSPSTIYRGLYVGSLGLIRGKTSRIRARFAFPAAGFVVAGEGSYAVGRGPRVAVGPGTLFGVYPGATFDYGPAEWWDEYYIGFAGPGASELLKCGLIPRGGRPRQVADVGAIVARFDDILRVWNRARPGDADRASVMGQALLLDLFHGQGKETRRSVDPIEAVLAACRARPQDAVDFVRVAARHRISYSQLRQGIRSRTGLAPAQYLTRLRCEAACVRLATTAAPIKSVADGVGIADPYTFSKTFRRTMGMSPTRYRATRHSYGSPDST